MTYTTAHDPDATLDYSITYADVMAETSPNDSISTSTWTANNGMQVESSSKTTTTTTVWLSGGQLGRYATATNTITTAAGRVYERSITFDIKGK